MIYVGIDLHRKRSQIAALDEQGTELLSRRVTAGRAVASPLRAPRAARTGLSFVKTRVRLTAVATMPANGRTAGTSPGHVAEEEGQLQGLLRAACPRTTRVATRRHRGLSEAITLGGRVAPVGDTDKQQRQRCCPPQPRLPQDKGEYDERDSGQPTKSTQRVTGHCLTPYAPARVSPIVSRTLYARLALRA
jgi:hypothetical protein